MAENVSRTPESVTLARTRQALQIAPGQTVIFPRCLTNESLPRQDLARRKQLTWPDQSNRNRRGTRSRRSMWRTVSEWTPPRAVDVRGGTAAACEAADHRQPGRVEVGRPHRSRVTDVGGMLGASRTRSAGVTVV